MDLIKTRVINVYSTYKVDRTFLHCEISFFNEFLMIEFAVENIRRT